VVHLYDKTSEIRICSERYWRRIWWRKRDNGGGGGWTGEVGG
jgi:hypothetical protein